jgi:hypothetical protein
VFPVRKPSFRRLASASRQALPPILRRLTTLHLIPIDVQQRIECHEWRNAAAVLREAHPVEWDDVIEMLRQFTLPKTWITNPGGNKTKISAWVDEFLGSRGWTETRFETAILVDEVRRDSPTHKVDCFKNSVGLEVEWNNKDPFYDRDLKNFRLLFELRAIEVGIIFTRCDELQQIFNDLGRGSSYGMSTTHMAKLLPRLEGGSGGGCPLLVFGISAQTYDTNS